MGLMQGSVQGDTFIVTDAFRLPVEGTETRVNAQDEANEYMVQYLQRARDVGQLENAVGWYHSHPGYGCWLSGIDVGTQGVRASLVDTHGRALGSGAAPITSDHRDGRRHEQDPEQWWTALCGAVREALRNAGDVQVTAVAIDATSGTVLVEHADGTPGGPALMYDDRRATEEVERVNVVGARVWERLGYQRMQPNWALPKLLWLLRAEARLARQGEIRLAPQSDFVNRRLVGTEVARGIRTVKVCAASSTSTVIWPASLMPAVTFPS